MGQHIFEKEWRALGTDIYVQIVGSASQAAETEITFLAVQKLYAAQERIFSRFDAESELSFLNAHLGEFCEASVDMLAVGQKSVQYFEESGGLFDPRILDNLEKIGYAKSFSENNFMDNSAAVVEGMSGQDLAQDLIVQGTQLKFLRRMDFSGIAKGYITDRVVEFLAEKGYHNFLVDSGGDMFAAGKNHLGDSWGISLEGRRDENEILLELSAEAVATSGNVRRQWQRGGKKFHHLINPHNVTDFSFALQSVTVVESTVERADVMAKVLFLLGLEKGLKLAEEKRMRTIFLQPDGEIIKTKYVQKI